MTTKNSADVRSDITDLADAIGLTYDAAYAPDEIINAISEELEAQIDEAESNPKELSVLMGYYRRLDALDSLLKEVIEVKINKNNVIKDISYVEYSEI